MRRPSAILLGSKPAAVVALGLLVERGWDVRSVVVARNFDLSWYGGRSVEDAAVDAGIPVVDQDDLAGTAPVDFVISYQFRNLVRPPVLGLARRAALNFHAAPLPEYGGFAYYNVAILEGGSSYGVSCHHMDEQFDTGPILEVRRFPIDLSRETAHSLEARAQEEMLRLFADVCVLAESERELPSTEQDESRRRYLKREEMEALKEIPPDADAETADRYARAFWYPPYEGAYVVAGGTRLSVVPRAALDQVGRALHAHDLDRLSRVL